MEWPVIGTFYNNVKDNNDVSDPLLHLLVSPSSKRQLKDMSVDFITF